MTDQRDDDTAALWAVHVEGPDDVIAMPDKATAETYAAGVNDWNKLMRQRPDDSEFDPNIHAKVIPWPYLPEGHAEEVARLDHDPWTEHSR